MGRATMDHSTALRIQACERYVLGELSEAEYSQFEEHFFSCPECAEDVKAVVAFAELAAPLLTEQGSSRRSAITRRLGLQGGWRSLPSLAAAAGVALLLGVTVYQSAVTVPRLRRELAQARLPQ